MIFSKKAFWLDFWGLGWKKIGFFWGEGDFDVVP